MFIKTLWVTSYQQSIGPATKHNLHVFKLSDVQNHIYDLCLKHILLTPYALNIEIQSIMLKCARYIGNPKVLIHRCAYPIGKQMFFNLYKTNRKSKGFIHRCDYSKGNLEGF